MEMLPGEYVGRHHLSTISKAVCN